MKFEEILPALREGKKIRRKDYTPDYYIYLDNDCLDGESLKSFLPTFSRIVDCFSLSSKDLLADDWEIVEEPLLTDDEKEFIKNILSFANDETITRICFNYQPEIKKTLIYFETEGHVIKCAYWEVRPSNFQNIEIDKYYSLKELGLDE